MLGIFLDLETTGLDPTRHRIIEIGLKVVDVKTQVEIGSFQSIVKQPHEVWEKRDSFSIEVNGFQWADLQQGLEEAEIGHRLVGLFRDWNIQSGRAVFICQNPAFDRSFFAQLIDLYTQERLRWPYHWLDLASMYWAFNVERCLVEGKPLPDEFILSKDEIAKNFNLPPEAKPHRAMNGVDHLILCYKALYSGLPALTANRPVRI